MKFDLLHAALIFLAGLMLVLVGVFVKPTNEHLSNPVILGGLAVEFIGTLWLVLGLNQRRKRSKL